MVIAAPADYEIRAPTTREPVISSASEDPVVAERPLQHVPPGGADERVVTGAAEHDFDIRPGVIVLSRWPVVREIVELDTNTRAYNEVVPDLVVAARAAVNRISPFSGIELVVPSAAPQEIVPWVAEEAVAVATRAWPRGTFGAGASFEKIVSLAAVEIVDLVGAAYKVVVSAFAVSAELAVNVGQIAGYVGDQGVVLVSEVNEDLSEARPGGGMNLAGGLTRRDRNAARTGLEVGTCIRYADRQRSATMRGERECDFVRFAAPRGKIQQVGTRFDGRGRRGRRERQNAYRGDPGAEQNPRHPPNNNSY